MSDAAATHHAPKLCLFTDSLEPSGVGEHMLTLAAALRETDAYRLSFVCPPSPAGVPLLERAGRLGLDAVALEVCDARSATEAFMPWLERERIDVFHGHAGIGWEGHFGVYAARYAGVPAVVRTEHLPQLLTDEAERRDHARMVEAADRLICVSEEARRSFVRAGIPEDKVCAVRNGITPGTARPDARTAIRAELGLQENARVALTVGRFSEQKGHRFLVDAIPDVIARVPGIRFLWVGTGPLEDEMRAQVRRLGLEDHVSFLGRRGDVPDLLAACDLFVLPSLFEGHPLIVLEAMAAGRAVVGTRCCGTSEAVADGLTGRLVEPGSPAALSAAIAEVLVQPALLARWGAEGRRLFEREFGAGRMAYETAAVYEELLRRTRPGAAQDAPARRASPPAGAPLATPS